MQEIPKIRRTGDDGSIIAFLSSKHIVPNKALAENIMDALRMIWLPFALRRAGDNDERLRESAIWCITQLKARIVFIEASFGIASSSVQPDINLTNVPIFDEVAPVEQKNKNLDEVEDIDIPTDIAIDLGDELDMARKLINQG